MDRSEIKSHKIDIRLSGERYKKFIIDAQMNGGNADARIPVFASLIALNVPNAEVGITPKELYSLLTDYISNPQNQVSSASAEKLKEYFANAFSVNLTSMNQKLDPSAKEKWLRS